MAKAATVAIRYGTVRRQGEIGPDGFEKQIISYPSTYYRLLPILSHAYVFIQLGKQLVDKSKAYTQQIQPQTTTQYCRCGTCCSQC